MNPNIMLLIRLLMYFLFFTALLSYVKSVSAYSYDGVNSQDEQAINQIMAPFNKVFNFVRIAAGSVAVFVLILAGIVYMTASGDVGKIERAKSMASGVVVGLMIFVVAPTVVQYLLGQ